MYIIGAIHIPYKHIVMNKNDGTDTWQWQHLSKKFIH